MIDPLTLLPVPVVDIASQAVVVSSSPYTSIVQGGGGIAGGPPQTGAAAISLIPIHHQNV